MTDATPPRPAITAPSALKPAGGRRARWGVAALALALAVHMAVVSILVLADRLRPQPPEPRAVALTLGPLGPSAAQVAAAGHPQRRAPHPPPLKPSRRPPATAAASAPTEPVAPPAPPPPQSVPFTLPQPDLQAEPLALHAPVLNTTGEAASTQALGLGIEACDLTLQIQAALAADAEVRAAVSRIPPSARTAANAVALWNAGWIEPDPSAPGVTAPFKRVITATLAVAKPICRTTTQAGPRFIALPESPSAGASTLIVVLGSGLWRWGDLAADPIGTSTP